jgi:hypothetical protein
MAREILDKEIAARDEAARLAARRAQEGPVARWLRGRFTRAADSLRPSRTARPAQPPVDELDFRVDTGELQRLMASDLGTFQAEPRRSGRPPVPAPRSRGEDVLVGDADR